MTDFSSTPITNMSSWEKVSTKKSKKSKSKPYNPVIEIEEDVVDYSHENAEEQDQPAWVHKSPFVALNDDEDDSLDDLRKPVRMKQFQGQQNQFQQQHVSSADTTQISHQKKGKGKGKGKHKAQEQKQEAKVKKVEPITPDAFAAFIQSMEVQYKESTVRLQLMADYVEKNIEGLCCSSLDTHPISGLGIKDIDDHDHVMPSFEASWAVPLSLMNSKIRKTLEKWLKSTEKKHRAALIIPMLKHIHECRNIQSGSIGPGDGARCLIQLLCRIDSSLLGENDLHGNVHGITNEHEFAVSSVSVSTSTGSAKSHAHGHGVDHAEKEKEREMLIQLMCWLCGQTKSGLYLWSEVLGSRFLTTPNMPVLACYIGLLKRGAAGGVKNHTPFSTHAFEQLCLIHSGNTANADKEKKKGPPPSRQARKLEEKTIAGMEGVLQSVNADFLKFTVGRTPELYFESLFTRLSASDSASEADSSIKLREMVLEMCSECVLSPKCIDIWIESVSSASSASSTSTSILLEYTVNKWKHGESVFDRDGDGDGGSESHLHLHLEELEERLARFASVLTSEGGGDVKNVEYLINQVHKQCVKQKAKARANSSSSRIWTMFIFLLVIFVSISIGASVYYFELDVQSEAAEAMGQLNKLYEECDFCRDFVGKFKYKT